jgi:hypothetical protein
VRFFPRESRIWLTLMVTVLAASICELASAQSFPPSCPGTLDYTDSTYGGMVRQIYKPDGHEHNLYHFRDPWNATNTYMVGIREDIDHSDWRVVLFDGNGCFIKELFFVSQYSWQVVWDRHDPNILYTWRSTRLYRYHVDTGQAELLKDYKPAGEAILVAPTLNQAGDRLLVVTSGNVLRSYQLPGMTNERAFTVPGLPANCDMRNVRYIGYQNYIAVECRNVPAYGSAIYNDTGVLLKKSARGIAHTDFSPTGQWAYFRMWQWDGAQPLEIHVVNLDGTNDRLLYSVPMNKALYVESLHISWPDRVNNWFVVSFFPLKSDLPSVYHAPLDEILRVNLDGTVQPLARTRMAYTMGAYFWPQPLASASSDGSRISFNSNCFNDAPGVDCTDSVTIDQYIVFTKP